MPVSASKRGLICDTLCGVVLAGGKSRRMGKDKPFIRLGGKTLIEHAASALSSIFTEVLIVYDAASGLAHRFNALPYRVISDRVSGLGPIGGIETALQSVSGKGVFVVAADMPFLNLNVIKAMIHLSEPYDLVIPEFAGQLHPLHALYTQNCLPAIEADIQAKRYALYRLAEEVKSHLFSEKVFRSFDPFLHSIVNINTPEDLVSARLLLKTIKITH